MLIGKGEYESINKLGEGAFGDVFKCRKRSTGETFAIKLIGKTSNHGSLSSMLESVTKAEDPDKMAKRELKAVLAIHHPNIVKLIDCGFDKDIEMIYIVMELCDCDLNDFLGREGNLSELEIKIIVAQIVRGLKHIHDQGKMHRDLKPQNILLKGINSSKLSVKIGDLGLVVASSSTTEVASGIGTPTYMAPEVYTGRYDKKVDVWSLGIIIYELLGSQEHFAGSSQNLPMPSGASAAMQSLLDGMLEKDPNMRLDVNQVQNHAFFN